MSGTYYENSHINLHGFKGVQISDPQQRQQIYYHRSNAVGQASYGLKYCNSYWLCFWGNKFCPFQKVHFQKANCSNLKTLPQAAQLQKWCRDKQLPWRFSCRQSDKPEDLKFTSTYIIMTLTQSPISTMFLLRSEKISHMTVTIESIASVWSLSAATPAHLALNTVADIILPQSRLLLGNFSMSLCTASM